MRQALQYLEYPERLQKLLLTPERELAVELAILKDNGEVEVWPQPAILDAVYALH